MSPAAPGEPHRTHIHHPSTDSPQKEKGYPLGMAGRSPQCGVNRPPSTPKVMLATRLQGPWGPMAVSCPRDKVAANWPRAHTRPTRPPGQGPSGVWPRGPQSTSGEPRFKNKSQGFLEREERESSAASSLVPCGAGDPPWGIRLSPPGPPSSWRALPLLSHCPSPFLSPLLPTSPTLALSPSVLGPQLALPWPQLLLGAGPGPSAHQAGIR